jgi:hypothetical protein
LEKITHGAIFVGVFAETPTGKAGTVNLETKPTARKNFR